MYLPSYGQQWKDLSAYIRVQSTRHLPTGDIETATRYYMTSLPYKKHNLMRQAIREHWQIENGLHYKLDVGMNEDQCPIYRGYADRNLSIMRKIVLKLLTQDTSNQDGIALKRMKAASFYSIFEKSDWILNFDEIALVALNKKQSLNIYLIYIG
nr:ISAs1 family transposase [Legionella israelensis]